MRLGIMGRKVGMTQVFNEAGAVVPVTVIEASQCYISQIKTKDSDGYTALQLAYGDRKLKNVDKARVGHYKKASVPARARMKEIRFECNKTDLSQRKPGEILTVNMFQKGDLVDVIGNTKGLGNTGVMKRYGYSGKDATHGTSKYFRHGGSNGTNTFPGRVLKNKGMPGRKGNDKTTVANLTIVDIKPEENLILVKGAIPGPKNGLVVVRSTKRQMKAPEGRTWVA